MKLCTSCGAYCNEDARFCASCGRAVVPGDAVDPLVGRVVGGAYLLEALVGVGGMGRVYRAQQRALGRTVAIKVIHPHLLGDDQTVARFYTEAKTSSRLNHPNSVGIIDFGRTDDGVLYLVMEYLEGRDLARVLAEDNALPLGRIVDILAGTLAALGEAHALGIVHRDLKPENILLVQTRSGRDHPKVVDFGLATIVGPGDPSVSSPGVICGTPDYMSPEQGRGDVVDGRGDLYSLGVVLFELLVGELPYVDTNPMRLVARHIEDDVPDPRERAPHRPIPHAFADVVVRAMAKDPSDRFQTAEEMEHALRGAFEGELGEGRVVRCRACGTDSPVGMRFCGSCGTRLSMSSLPPTTGRFSRAPYAAGDAFSPPFVGRDAELERLVAMLDRAEESAVFVQVVGEEGVGRTQLFRELAERAVQRGDVVAFTGPHPSGAPVPYAAARSLATALVGGAGPTTFADAVRDSGFAMMFDIPLVRAGFEELKDARGLTARGPTLRSGAVAAFLAALVRYAIGEQQARRAVIVVDDLGRCDPPSRLALQELTTHGPALPMLLLTTADGPALSGTAARLPVRGLDAREARRLLAALPGGDRVVLPVLRVSGDGPSFLPYHLHELAALGPLPDGAKTPARLADTLVMRIERLGAAARRLLQTLAVLGDEAPLAHLETTLERPRDMTALDALAADHMVVVHDARVMISHHFLRDVAESTIPAEARRALHQRALEVASERAEPLEVRAEHAYRSGDAVTSLMLLERMGDAAVARGDGATAVLAFQRALEVARRATLVTGDPMLERAIVTFSRKLGESLVHAGDGTGADGALREALDLAGPDGRERARMLVALGRAASLRERPATARERLREALAIADATSDLSTMADAKLTLARLLEGEADAVGAANELRAASDALEAGSGTLVQRARVALELADVLTDVGDTEEATRFYALALSHARSTSAPALAASALAALASSDELAGRRELARSRYEEAVQLAAEAGDVEGFRRFSDAAYTLSV